MPRAMLLAPMIVTVATTHFLVSGRATCIP